MKIGILTYHHALNYGAVLQCYALIKQLKIMGYAPIVINLYRRPNILFSTLGKIKRLLNGQTICLQPGWSEFRKHADKLLLPKTKYLSPSSVNNFDFSSFDAIIVGSDQIWRDSEKSLGNGFFLDFLQSNLKTKRISYAASFGKNTWEDECKRTKKVAELLSLFDHVSVREKSGVCICNNIFNIDAKQVLDPTLLIEQKVYNELIFNIKSDINQEYVISYYLGENCENNVDFTSRWSHELGYKYKDLYTLGKYDDKSNPGLHVTPEEWLVSIAKAKYVITNSFHATVFSILFHKQFLVVDLPSGGSTRLHDLLDSLGLNERFIKSIDDISIEKINKPILYDRVDGVLDTLRKHSINFLHQALKV